MEKATNGSFQKNRNNKKVTILKGNEKGQNLDYLGKMLTLSDGVRGGGIGCVITTLVIIINIVYYL